MEIEAGEDQTTSVPQISSDLKLAHQKKEALRQSFERLHSSSSLLSPLSPPFSLTLQWPDLEPHLATVESSLLDRLNLVRSRMLRFQSDLDAIKSAEDRIAATRSYLDEKSRVLESKERRLAASAAACADVKPEPFDDSGRALRPKVKPEPIDDPDRDRFPAPAEADRPCPDGSLRLWFTMDGKDLLEFLIENAGRLESMKDEVFTALKTSSDPAQLVLDAVNGFLYRSPEAKRSCILLLEQLGKLSPFLRPSVRQEAVRLAGQWKEEIGDWGLEIREGSLEVLGFLHLVAAFRLFWNFDWGELLRLLETITDSREATKLRHLFGLGGKPVCTISKQ